jgi:hypothetical protein
VVGIDEFKSSRAIFSLFSDPDCLRFGEFNSLCMCRFNGLLNLSLLASKDIMFAKITSLSILRLHSSLKLVLLSSPEFILSVLRFNNILLIRQRMREY